MSRRWNPGSTGCTEIGVHPGTPFPVGKALARVNELDAPGGVITKVAIVTHGYRVLGRSFPSMTADPANPAGMTTWGSGTPVTPPSMPLGVCVAVISVCPWEFFATTIGYPVRLHGLEEVFVNTMRPPSSLEAAPRPPRLTDSCVEVQDDTLYVYTGGRVVDGGGKVLRVVFVDPLAWVVVVVPDAEFPPAEHAASTIATTARTHSGAKRCATRARQLGCTPSAQCLLTAGTKGRTSRRTRFLSDRPGRGRH